jgi:hypothetical protein
MEEFVNYKKRGIDLPSGCKDLLDVLHKAPKHRPPSAISSRWVPIPKPERIRTHGLDHILRFIVLLLESTAKFTSLKIDFQGMESAMSVYRHREPGTFDLMFFVRRDTEEERAIRAFFVRHQIDHTVDYLVHPIAPNSVRGLQYPLPQDAREAARLIRNFLQTVYGVRDEAGVDYTFDKHEQAA